VPVHRPRISDYVITTLATHGGRTAVSAKGRSIMLLAHAALLSEARSYIAALADNAQTAEASSAYDLALIELDWVHGEDAFALDSTSPTVDRDVLLALATSAVERLTTYGVDELYTELLLASLEDARTLDMP
jgi:hypothetical protein